MAGTAMMSRHSTDVDHEWGDVTAASTELSDPLRSIVQNDDRSKHAGIGDVTVTTEPGLSTHENPQDENVDLPDTYFETERRKLGTPPFMEPENYGLSPPSKRTTLLIGSF
jgi:hypothetical protein